MFDKLLAPDINSFHDANTVDQKEMPGASSSQLYGKLVNCTLKSNVVESM